MSMHQFTRRQFGKKVAAAGGALTVGSSLDLEADSPTPAAKKQDWLHEKRFLGEVLGTDLSQGSLYQDWASCLRCGGGWRRPFTAPLIHPFAPAHRRAPRPAPPTFVCGFTVIRLCVCSFHARSRPFADESPMLEWSPAMKKMPAHLSKMKMAGWSHRMA